MKFISPVIATAFLSIVSMSLQSGYEERGINAMSPVQLVLPVHSQSITQLPEIERLLQQGKQQFRNSELHAALDTYQQVLNLQRNEEDRLATGQTLYQIAVIYRMLGEYNQATNPAQQALEIAQSLNDLALWGRTTGELGIIAYNLSQYPQALKHYRDAIAIAQDLGDRSLEARMLDRQGEVYRRQDDYPRALDLHTSALAISREIGDREIQPRIFNNIGIVDEQMGEYERAIDWNQQALTIARKNGNRYIEARILNSLGIVYDKTSQFNLALKTYQDALSIRQEIPDRPGIGRTLNNIALVYYAQSQYERALDYYNRALEIRRAIGDRIGEGLTLSNIGLIYWTQGEYSEALVYHQQALNISRAIGDRSGIANNLSGIGGIYVRQGRYPQALEYYQNALSQRQAIGDRLGQGYSLNRLGGVYYRLGDYNLALDYYQQALELRQEIGDRAGQGVTLNNIGLVYDSLDQLDMALDYYEQALRIREEIGDRAGAAHTLNNIGLIYDAQTRSEQALEIYEQALTIREEIGDRAGFATTLNNIGLTYENLGELDQALNYYQRALGIFRAIETRTGERLVLSNIANILAQQGHPELAIVFYKESVNLTEQIRQDIQSLPLSQQKKYTQTVTYTYRQLADLLLSQGRIIEAQKVLELLKIEELRNFTRNPQAGGQNSGIRLSSSEKQIRQEYGSLIAFGQEIEQCRSTQCSQLNELLNRRDSLTLQYNQTIEQFEEEIRRRRSQDHAFLNPTQLSRTAQKILESQPKTVIIYPFVLEDKIWILWAASGGIIKTVEVSDINRLELSETVVAFRELLSHPSSRLSRVKATSQKLYNWLIKPIEAELEANEINHLVFSLDRVTRYIPVSALFDGNQYLLEKYAISTILSAELTDFRDRLSPASEVNALALGVSKAIAGYNPLPNVPDELDAIILRDAGDRRGIYSGLEFLDEQFDFQTLRNNLYGHDILHIATHGDFVPGNPEDSYLLLGTGEKLAISEISLLQDLANVHLVVLSACQTALGGSGEDGIEFAGMSYYFLNQGAKSVIASLWLVNDTSTRLLMEQFYQNLAESNEETPISKAEALRQAQLSLLSENSTFSFYHPYYWASFILIGNGF